MPDDEMIQLYEEYGLGRYDAAAEAAEEAAALAAHMEQRELDLANDPVCDHDEVAWRLKRLATDADSVGQAGRGGWLRELAEDVRYTVPDWDGESGGAYEPYDQPELTAHLRARREEAEGVLREAGWEVFPAEEQPAEVQAQSDQPNAVNAPGSAAALETPPAPNQPMTLQEMARSHVDQYGSRPSPRDLGGPDGQPGRQLGQ
ncbi:MAG TPA: hypothetical protein VGL36_35430 [Kribbella sp.]